MCLLIPHPPFKVSPLDQDCAALEVGLLRRILREVRPPAQDRAHDQQHLPDRPDNVTNPPTRKVRGANGYNKGMAEREQKRGGAGCALGCTLVLLLLPVLYVLSIGPAAWFDSQLPPPGSPLLHTLFTPLDYAGETYEPIGVWLDWYVSFWL
jgi:hypothetical protein